MTNRIAYDIIEREVKEMTEQNERYTALRLKNQLCFPLYAVSNIITRRYKPLLDRLNLTYTQYIVMMVLWEEGEVNEKFLCEALFLQSNTMTPLLKKLTEKGYIRKERSGADERKLVITLTESGRALQEKALCVPESIAKEFALTPEEAMSLYQTLYKILEQERKKTK